MEVRTRLIPLWSAKQPLIGGLLLMMWCMYLYVYVLEVVSLIFSNWQRFSYFRSVWRQLATKRPLHINLKWFVKNAFLQSIPSSVTFQKEERRRGRKGNLTMMTASWEKIDWTVPKRVGKSHLLKIITLALLPIGFPKIEWIFKVVRQRRSVDQLEGKSFCHELQSNRFSAR